MNSYAVYDGQSIVNVIVADNKEIAESVTGFECFDLNEISRQEAYIVDNEEFIVDLHPSIGWFIHNNEWVPQKPLGNYDWNGHMWVNLDLVEESQ